MRFKLAYKFLFWFWVISLVPLAFMGSRLIQLSQVSLKKESLRIQESLAVGFADTVHNYITTYKNILIDVAHIKEFSSNFTAEKQQPILSRLMQLHAAFLELSVFDLKGVEVVRLGRFFNPGTSSKNFSQDTAFLRARAEGEYVGSLERFSGVYPTLTIAVVIRNPDSQAPSGVLMGKIGLNGLSQMLHQQFPDPGQSQAAVIGPEGFLIAHSDREQVFRKDAGLPDAILQILMTQPQPRGGGEITLPEGKKLLGAFSGVKDLGWVVYVQQPVKTAYQTADQMKGQITRMLVWVLIGTAILSFLIANRISKPIRLLKEAAEKMGQGQFEVPVLISTNDEIEDLEKTFIQMGESLKQKNTELINAKDELEKLNRTLESRVDARTRELKSAQDELIKKERLAAIGQMASVVGHEIRNPLAVISNSIYFIKIRLTPQKEELDAKISKHIAIIESEIQQANGIINEILTFARTRELKPETKTLNSFLEELLSTYPVPERIQVVREYSRQDPVVFIDPQELRQAVRNLITNAIDAMPQGGTLKVSTAASGEWAQMSVADSGAGIPREVLEKIFAPFFTTKARGTGLGLAVVRKVIDRHQGKVEVESGLGKGTVFKLYLPAVKKPGSILHQAGRS